MDSSSRERTNIWGNMSRGRRTPGLADRLHRQRRTGCRACRASRPSSPMAVTSCSWPNRRMPRSVAAPAYHGTAAAWLAGKTRAEGRTDRLRPAADQRGRAGSLYGRRPDNGPDGTQSDGRGLDRSAGAASRAGACLIHLIYAGRSSEEKRADIAKTLRDAKQDAAVLTDPASIAWLLNIRGGDVPFTPFALGFALVHAECCNRPVHRSRQAVGRNPDLAGQRGVGRGSGCAAAGAARAGGKDRAGRYRRFAGLVLAATGEGRAPWWHPEAILACCRRPARTRSNSRVRGRRICATPSRCAASCIGFRSQHQAAGRPRCRPPTPCWRSAGRSKGFRGESFPGDFRRGRAWRDHPLSRDGRSRTGQSGRTRCI